ncbi:iron chaperone [soil metagenome]
MATPSSVQDYLAALPEERRVAMEQLRQTIKAAAPEAAELISYNMPAFKSHGGQFLVSYAAFKRHYSLFPASEAVIEAAGEELTPYLSGKGTIRFPADAPIPIALVETIVKTRLQENAAHERR